MTDSTETTTGPLRIDIVSDVVCPWCVIGYRQLAQALKDTGTEAEIHWHPFELNPDMGPDGQNLREHIAEKYGSSPEDSAKSRERLTAMGAELGFTFAYTDDMRMVNTFRAHQLLHWAEEQGREHDLKMALFEAFFSRREDLNDPDVLVAVVESIGLDGTEARTVLEQGHLSDTVRQREVFWLKNGVQGVPAMVFEQKYLETGAMGVENYTTIIEHLKKERAGEA